MVGAIEKPEERIPLQLPRRRRVFGHRRHAGRPEGVLESRGRYVPRGLGLARQDSRLKHTTPISALAAMMDDMAGELPPSKPTTAHFMATYLERDVRSLGKCRQLEGFREICAGVRAPLRKSAE